MEHSILSAAGRTIPVHVARHEGRTLIECREPAPFLAHVFAHSDVAALPPSAVLRGLVTPGDGAVLEIHDVFGTLAREISLTEFQARRLLASIR